MHAEHDHLRQDEGARYELRDDEVNGSTLYLILFLVDAGWVTAQIILIIWFIQCNQLEDDSEEDDHNRKNLNDPQRNDETFVNGGVFDLHGRLAGLWEEAGTSEKFVQKGREARSEEEVSPWVLEHANGKLPIRWPSAARLRGIAI